MKILDGKKIALMETMELKKEFDFISSQLKRSPVLTIVQVGDNESSSRYVSYKIKKGQELVVDVRLKKFDANIKYEALLRKIEKINDESDGVIVQLPLPEGDLKVKTQVILDSIPPIKDIDGLCNRNSFLFYNDKKEFHLVPATALAIDRLLKHYQIGLDNHKIGVVGRSNLVGKPIAHMLKSSKAFVQTYNRNSGIKGVESADLVIVAAGSPGLIKKENLKPDSIVIDVGATWVPNEEGTLSIKGDVDTTDLDNHIQAIAPVPGGVGPLTVVYLFKNLAKTIEHKNHIKYEMPIE
ncbi:bifunctional 5,10-methylenetetrahydrofolate dehydrogenase/5,10-methenyltetrahydrofolate cyclohydrolase [Mycoplasmopsis gallinarum]|uniref:bifunctional 5,10-methylenetetrahydrofolate dehydrogenase/5,10-methenyltetrahydrofolate cyclohydrolase n=1 Tax=Mycoplasmopsis gallinarum TaxID=29557 RepID=UPI0004863A80|nr:bifunctional 5,10-methylenetetrahydrofolate dehydrogenase/5,10-methenyltetrahydrofolate cyclohydrolase [Mycoplasmopsis gallinarum]